MMQCYDAMLKMKKVLDLDMYILFEKGMRGEICCISNRYIKTINKVLKSYDLKQESRHIIYLDANNLYGYAISKFLPTHGFKWINPKEFDLNKYTSNSSEGCVLEVDSKEYPKRMMIKQNMTLFIDTKKQKQLLMKVIFSVKVRDKIIRKT